MHIWSSQHDVVQRRLRIILLVARYALHFALHFASQTALHFALILSVRSDEAAEFRDLTHCLAHYAEL